MSQNESVTVWIHKLKVGETEAAQQLWERYFRRLVAVARTKLGSLPRRVSDEEDVALSAFHSFCQAVDKERFPELSNRDDLWQILLMHTARKVVDHKRYQNRQKRGGDVVHVTRAETLQEVIGDEPDPQFVLEVAEEFDFLMAQLKTEDLRTIALRKLEGCTNEEIATVMGFSESTIRRKMTLIRRCWEEKMSARDNS